MSAAGWLFEIGVEELPYKTCQSVLAQLQGKATAESPGMVYEALAAARLLGDGGAAADRATDPAGFAEARLKVMIAPRRIAVWVKNVPREQTAQTLRHRGPLAKVAFGPDGAPTKAGEGFARGKGIKPGQLVRETVDGNEFVVAVVEAERLPAERVLPDICRRLITGLQIPRGMRWGARPAGADDYLRFSRPIRWLVCIFAGQPVPFDFYDLRAGAVTQGHRVLGRPLIVDHASHYERHLREQHVIADHNERRRLIVEGLHAAAGRLGGRWSDPAGVLEENIYLAEWPSVHSGAFDERHLRLPSEVLITAMQAHQRYCPVEDAPASCAPPFSTSPTPTRLPPRSSRTATSACSRAAWPTPSSATTATWPKGSRPWPAAWARSSFTPSWARSPTSRRAWWPSRSGWPAWSPRATAAGRALAAAADTAAAVAAAADQGLTVRVTDELAAAVIAAKFAKADLVSQVVIEFPSLQGRVGGHYADKAGAAPAVAQAIADHYQPLSAVAPLPGSLAGSLVAVADKIDNIAGAWLAGNKPSGSRDPYGLRRAAMGIVRIALEHDLRVSPRTLAAAAVRVYAQPADATKAVLPSKASGPDPEGAIAAFIWERLEALLLDEGLPFALVEAALGAAAQGADLSRVAALARTFARVEHEAFFNDLVVAFSRPAALAAKAEAEPGGVAAAPDPALFADEAEHALAAALTEVRGPIGTALAGGDIEAALCAAAALRAPVDRYFEAVLVMDNDPAVRANRLAQLRQVTFLLGGLGDLARLPVQQS